MSRDTHGTGSVRELREAAREQARGIPAGLVAIGGAFAAILLIGLFVLLDYRFDQDPHRLVKILLGATVVASIVMRPRFGLWLLPVATPFLPWMPQLGIPGVNVLNVLMFSIFGSFAFMRIIQRRPFLRGGRLTGPILVIGVLGTLSVFRGAAIPTGYEYDAGLSGLILFRSMVTLLVYFVTRSMVQGASDRRWMAWALVTALVLEAVITILYGRNGRGGRAIGSIGQANELGTFLALYAMVGAAMLPAVRAWVARVVLLAGSVAAVAATMMSVSRSAIIAIGLGFVYVALRSSRGLALLLVMVGLSSPLWIPDYVKERWTETTVAVEGTDEAILEGAAQARVDTWKAMTTIITEHPLDGVGFAGLSYILPQTGEELGLEEVKDSSHNTFLRFLAEMGVLGLLALLWLLWRCWAMGWRAARTATNPLDRQLGVALGAATLVLVISCAFGDRFFPITVTGNFWILAALVDDVIAEQRSARA